MAALARLRNLASLETGMSLETSIDPVSTHEISLATPLGAVRLAARDHGLIGLWFCGQKYELPSSPVIATAHAVTVAVLEQGSRWLDQYFAGKADAPPPKLTPRGTAFQHEVWAGLATIAPATRMSYAALAAAIGKPAAVRAVAAAVGRNPLSILVPCHRVIGSSGQLTGFAGGLGRKRALLALEMGEPLPWRPVLRSYATQYPDPIDVAVGESVRFVDRSDDGEYAGWKWAIAGDGRQGWVPQSYFSVNAAAGRALRGYSARELDVHAGDEILELDAFSGWLWVIDRKLNCGWIPQVSVYPN